MKHRFLPHALGGALLALAFATPALAQSYPATPAMLQDIDDYYGNTWFHVVAPLNSNAVSPGKSPSVTGNGVALTGNATPDDVNFVFGAINFNDGAAVSGNTVSVSGPTTTVYDEVAGGRHSILSGDAAATNNTVTVGNGTVGSAMGGVTEAYGVGGNATSVGNSVEISGSAVVQGSVTGGWAYGNGGTATASNNTVTISGTPGLATAGLYGGRATGGGATVVSTGNTLQMKTAGVSVEGLNDFQKFRFILPASLAAGGTVLTVTGWADIGTDTPVTVSAASGLSLAAGDEITLIDAEGAMFSGNVASTAGSFTSGGNSYAYTLSITDDQKLLMTINSVTPLGTGAAAVPTLGEYALALLALMLAGMAVRRRV